MLPLFPQTTHHRRLLQRGATVATPPFHQMPSVGPQVRKVWKDVFLRCPCLESREVVVAGLPLTARTIPAPVVVSLRVLSWRVWPYRGGPLEELVVAACHRLSCAAGLLPPVGLHVAG